MISVADRRPMKRFTPPRKLGADGSDEYSDSSEYSDSEDYTDSYRYAVQMKTTHIFDPFI